jgi:putative membrane-bound dehydrogenase-like protein
MLRLLAIPAVLLLSAAGAAQDLVARTEPLTAAEQQKRFRLPPGFEIQLVACEPDVIKPMNLSFDDRGRLFATQSEEYPYPARAGARPRDAVKCFEDFGPDGRARKVSTAVDGLNIPIGILATGDGLLVHSIPKVWKCADADGDGRYEKRDPLYGDYGFQDTHGMTNAFTPWVDGWVYACHGFANRSSVSGSDGKAITMHSGNVYRMRPDGSRVEYHSHGQVNPFGLSFDPLGNLFSADCHSKPAMLLLRGAWYPTFDGQHDGLGVAPGIMQHQHGSSGIAGVVYYAATQFPAAYHGTLFMGNPVTGRINHDRLEVRGSSYKAVELPDFLKCEDPWFRPVDLELAPDGTLYVADFYNRIIGHYEVPLDHPGRDRTRGRIWRIVYTGEGAAPPKPMPDLAGLGARELVALLRSDNLAVRTRVTNRLVERFGKEAAAELKRFLQRAGDSPSWQRAHGVWVMERLGALDEAEVREAARSESLVKVHLLKALAERPTWTFETELARGKLKDGDAFVRRAAVEALGLHPDLRNLPDLLDLWAATPPEDVQLLHTLRMAVRDTLKVPGGFEAAAALPAHAGRIANVCPGIKDETSARFLFDRMREGNAQDAAALRHVARHLPADALPAVFEYAQKLRDPVGTFRALHQAVQERGLALPPSVSAWAQSVVRRILAGDAHADVREGLKLVRDLRLQGVQEEVARLAEGRLKAGDIRGAAIEAMGGLDPAGSVPVLGRILGDASEPIELRQKAASALAGLNAAESRAELARQLRTAPQLLAVHIAAGLAGTREGGDVLLREVEEGRASRRLLVEKTVDGRLKAVKSPELAGRAKKLTADLPPEDDRIRKLIESRRASFGKAKPDLARGAEVFAKNCAGCHRIEGKGTKIGPELDGVGHRGLDRILEDVLDPNRNVDQAFRATLLKTADGRVLSGLVLREEGQVLVIQEAADRETRVPVKDIEQRVLSLLSPMPANVVDAIPEADFHSLVGYLLSQRQGR